MAYVAVAKALFEYAAQDPETELSFREDQILYVIEKEDAEWVAHIYAFWSIPAGFLRCNGT